jgi:hypothetical protein
MKSRPMGSWYVLQSMFEYGSWTDEQDSLTSNIDVTNLPLHPSPPGIANGQLKVDLLPHQSQAIQVSFLYAFVWDKLTE